MALTEKLKAIADAIRGKTGKTDGLTLDQMPTEIEGIEVGGGGEILFSSGGQAYTELVVTLPDDYTHLGSNVGNVADPEFTAYTRHDNVFSTYGVVEGYAPETVVTSGHYPFCSAGNPLLRKLVAPKCTRLKEAYWVYRCTALEYVQLGSVGYPVTFMGGELSTIKGFANCTNKNLVIEVYVDAETIADISADITAPAPWGATNATIIYRNSTTGEVITE